MFNVFNVHVLLLLALFDIEIHKTHSMILLLCHYYLSIYHSYRIVKKLRIALILLERNWNAWVPWMTGNLIVCTVVRNAVGQEDAVVLVNCKKMEKKCCSGIYTQRAAWLV